MTISKEKVREIARKYHLTIINEDDAENAFRFVWDILTEEADAIRKSEPHAVVTIRNLESAAHEVFDIESDVLDAMSGFWA